MPKNSRAQIFVYLLTLLLVYQAVPSFASVENGAQGFLKGKHIYLSPGHGWYYHGDPSFKDWLSQRGNTHGVVEDMSNVESVSLYLVDYLRRAGAQVWMCREADLNPKLVIVDNQDGTTRPENGTYQETGSWSDSGLGGFVNFRWPYSDGDPVFLTNAQGGRNRLVNSAASVTATARWTPNIPAAGWYNVSVSYTEFTARSTAAHYVVYHKGGESHFYINQQRHGSTWIDLGQFWFDAGINPSTGSVVLQNDGTAGSNVSADAVKFGGGFGFHKRGDGISGYPRFEEAGRYYAFFQGAPASVYDPISSCYDAQTGCGAGDDASARPKYAAWRHQDDEDALYLSWHSNAGGGRGTSTFYHTNQASNSQSAFLTGFVHNEMVADIRATISATWSDRGIGQLSVGELSPTNNPEMPATLIETAFHDNATDAALIRTPRFRQTVARAVYQGIAKYYANRDNLPVKLQPDAPTHFSVRSNNLGQALLNWQAPPSGNPGGDAATGYIVYRSLDGKAFDNGRQTASVAFTDDTVQPGEIYYYKITARNDGGESPATEVLTVKVAPAGQVGKMLIVSGYDRWDKFMVPNKPGGRDIGTPNRERPEWVNTFDYCIQHAEALRALDIYFDSSSNEALAATAIPLTGYALIDWIAGRNASVTTEDPALYPSFTTAEQTVLRQFTDSGGHLFVSGSEILYDLDRDADTADEPSLFARQVLRAAYVGDDAGTYNVSNSAVPFLPNPAPAPTTPSGYTSYTLSPGNLYIPDGYQPPLDAFDLVIHFHGADSTVVENHTQSGKSSPILVINYPGLSSAYSVPFSDRHLFRQVIDNVRTRMSIHYGRQLSLGKLTVSTFSAGYGAAREILKYPDYEGMITDLLMCDSLHAGYINQNGSNVPNPADLVDFARFAKRAARGLVTFSLTHSQIVPGTYASTRETADYLISAAGTTRTSASGTDATGMTLESTATRGNFRVRSYQGNQAADHIAQLTQMQELNKLSSLPLTVPHGTFAFSDGTGAFYAVDFPDRVGAVNGSIVAQTYLGGTGDGAATAFSGNHRSVFLGYPFESLLTTQARQHVMSSAVRFLLPPAGSVGMNVSAIPASGYLSQSIPVTISLASSLDFPINTDVWVRIVHESGGPVFENVFASNAALTAGGNLNIPGSFNIPLSAPGGVYTLTFQTGDKPNHAISSIVRTITMSGPPGLADEFDGPTLNTDNWRVVGLINGTYFFNSGQLVINYGSSSQFAGVDLFTQEEFTGDVAFSTSIGSVTPGSGTHVYGIGFGTAPRLPDYGPLAMLTLEASSAGSRTVRLYVRDEAGVINQQTYTGQAAGSYSLSLIRNGALVSASAVTPQGNLAFNPIPFSAMPVYGWLRTDNNYPAGSGGGLARYDNASIVSSSEQPVSLLTRSLGMARFQLPETGFYGEAIVAGGGTDRITAWQSPDRSAGALARFTGWTGLRTPNRNVRLEFLGSYREVGGVKTLYPFRWVQKSSSTPSALDINNRTLATSVMEANTGVNLTIGGMLVRTSGNVRHINETGGYFLIDDGSRVWTGADSFEGVRVRYRSPGASNLITPPAVNSLVRVTGVAAPTLQTLTSDVEINGQLFQAGQQIVIPEVVLRSAADYLLNP